VETLGCPYKKVKCSSGGYYGGDGTDIDGIRKRHLGGTLKGNPAPRRSSQLGRLWNTEMAIP